MLLIGFLICTTATAQMPHRTPPANAQWTIAVREAQPATPAAEETPRAGAEFQPSTLSYTRVGGLIVARVEFRNGERREYWFANGHVLSKAANGRIIILRDDPLSRPFPYASPGFYGMENLKPEDLVGEVEFDGAPAILYSGRLRGAEIEPLAPDPTPSADEDPAEFVAPQAQTYDAWFDPQTRLPRAYREGSATLTYTFSPPPTTLVLPEEYRTALEQYRENLRRLRLN